MMNGHPTITALRATAPHAESPLPWREDDSVVRSASSNAVAQWAEWADAAHIAAAVNAAPVLLAEVDALRAQLEALVGLVERWPELDCASWCSDLRCTCGAEDQNLARAAARLALGLGVK